MFFSLSRCCVDVGVVMFGLSMLIKRNSYSCCYGFIRNHAHTLHHTWMYLLEGNLAISHSNSVTSMSRCDLSWDTILDAINSSGRWLKFVDNLQNVEKWRKHFFKNPLFPLFFNFCTKQTKNQHVHLLTNATKKNHVVQKFAKQDRWERKPEKKKRVKRQINTLWSYTDSEYRCFSDDPTRGYLKSSPMALICVKRFCQFSIDTVFCSYIQSNFYHHKDTAHNNNNNLFIYTRRLPHKLLLELLASNQ